MSIKIGQPGQIIAEGVTATLSWVNFAIGVTRFINSFETGTTAKRPTARRFIGQRYFDTDLGYPIWWDGVNWVDATGTTV